MAALGFHAPVNIQQLVDIVQSLVVFHLPDIIPAHHVVVVGQKPLAVLLTQAVQTPVYLGADIVQDTGDTFAVGAGDIRGIRPGLGYVGNIGNNGIILMGPV